MKRKRTWLITYCLVLAAFTIYFLLDTFVITRVYGQEATAVRTVSASDSSENNKGLTASSDTGTSANTGLNASKQAVQATENSYSDENIRITITEYRVSSSTVYVADIQLSSADYLKTALARSSYGKNVTDKTSSIASGVNAILAINGDYYGSQEKGYVIRNGVIYRSTAASNRQDLVIYKDGSFEIVNEKEVSAKELLEKGAQQVLSFGPALVQNGSVSINSRTEVGRAMASNPRTAIGIIDDLHYIFVVSDGRTSESTGLTLYELAEFMQSLGADTAYNLDGGGSSTMYFNGQVVNNPTTNGSIKERSVSDIVYIGY